MTRWTDLLIVAMLVVVAGCHDVSRVRASEQRVVKDATPEEVLTEAAVVLQREFGRVNVDRANLRITTVPAEYMTVHDSGTARDLYRGRSTMRRLATFTVSRHQGSPVARLRINVERQDTVRQQVMQPRGHRLSDTPGQETPIDHDAATTHEQNTVWTHVRRDTNLERALLEELRERIARRVTGTEPADASAEPPDSAPEARTENPD